MKRQQKKIAEDFIKLLFEAHRELKKIVKSRDTASAAQLLDQCQQGAVQLGTLIEEEEGEGFATVKLLEDYCESLYQTYELLSQEQYGEFNSVHKKLHQHLIGIENSVKYDIKARLEVVFLPYKASMWDSLESIWKAAQEDQDSDVYVIPIPYYKKKNDGSLGELCYEGDQYPDYVPITKYDAYDITQRHPDMIFIHNPYDEYNRVTSVHPFFYSGNLKKYTEKLVYVPYFILDEVSPDDEQGIQGVKPFCVVPGVTNADRVIVQSDDMRQIYLDVLSHGRADGSQHKLKNKVMALGSPKVDKLVTAKKENLHIPKEWMDKIRKPDGSRKKIIFYNTTITSLLTYGQGYLEKIKDTWKVFEEYNDQYVLLWRPHPLAADTISAMRPELYESYTELVAAYKEKGTGIYDDSSDMYRAIAVSDAYYGDVGSVMVLYLKTGLPALMLQDYGKRNETLTPAGDCDNE